MKKSSKVPFLSALMIGILGTAIWEKILSPLCTLIFVKISSLIGNFVVFFSNITYKEISKGYHDTLVINIIYYMAMILSIILAIFYITYVTNRRKSYFTKYFLNDNVEDDPVKEFKRIKKTDLIIVFSVSILLIIFMYYIGNLGFITKCKVFSLCNLEIISPYVSDLEYKELKSSFYSIETKEDYESFINTIKEIGEQHSLSLKE